MPEVFIPISVGSQIIGFNDVVIGRAIAEGLLKKSDAGIALSELAKFRADYVSPSEVSEWFGGSPIRFVSIMRESGVVPVAILAKVYIWRRADVERIFGSQRTRKVQWIEACSAEV